ncbi:hypothetical protein N7517_008578 [Penicillium concentricum]|uniref:Zn(2)-C6 fungal-type domain-containing protein n=1 Tax=Penicillium concentricum TaxID=293559 RepID=A0A9W9RSM3_9EURO|nr:uncharacterized protein N7517_008578 [Penicillium concentricum]KAJ5365692.1 hypothetical protein N7517_008578 [Penicillium concentricum]
MTEASKTKRRRNRVPISCFSCRTLKTKCDGARPVCSTCANNGRECTFVPQGIAKGTSTMVLVKEDYLRTLEKHFESVKSAVIDSTPDTTIDSGPSAAVQDQQASDPTCSLSSTVTPNTKTLSSTAIAVDSNVSIGCTSFTRSILNSLHDHNSLEGQSEMSGGETPAKQSYLTLEDLYILPDNTPEVLDRYFTLRNIIAPLFHEPTVRPIFNAALRCPPEERHLHRSSFILLNMILAICASHWLLDVDENNRTARKHHDIAMTLLQPTMLRDWTLEHVQALLLGARYLQGTNRVAECWNTLGLAIRIAHGLRLHQEPHASDPPPLRETKRRVWYSIYMLDMHWSMIYERPAATRSSEFSVCVPEDLDDVCIQADRVLYPTPRLPSFLSFFLQNIKLYRIVEKTLAHLSERRHERREKAEMVMSLDEDYQTWLRERPAHLILNTQDPPEPVWILALRGNMVCILIHRQSLATTLHERDKPGPIEESTVYHILRSSQRICINAAIDSIDVVALRHEHTKESIGLDWFNVYYLFNAVIALVSYIINPSYTHDPPILEKMEKALHMIKSMSRNHSFAQRAHSFLRQLIEYMHPPQVPQERRSDFHTQTEPRAAAGTSDMSVDLSTLFDMAQNLTGHLESQLGDFDCQGLSEPMWTFNEEAPFDYFP